MFYELAFLPFKAAALLFFIAPRYVFVVLLLIDVVVLQHLLLQFLFLSFLLLQTQALFQFLPLEFVVLPVSKFLDVLLQLLVLHKLLVLNFKFASLEKLHLWVD